MTNRPHKHRQGQRLILPSSLDSRLNGRLEAKVLDLSIRGARIEHRDLVRPGQAYTLSIDLPRPHTPIHVVARTVWSVVLRIEPGAESTTMVYRSGLEFEGLTSGASQRIAEFLCELELSERHDRQAAGDPRAGGSGATHQGWLPASGEAAAGPGN